MIAFRKAHPSIGRPTYWRGDVEWHGPDGPADFRHESRQLAYLLRGGSCGDDDLYVMVNGHWEAREFRIAAGPPFAWRRVIDTGLASPLDIAEPGNEAAVESESYRLGPRSVAVLLRASPPT
jgi:glycogen operon protein